MKSSFGSKKKKLEVNDFSFNFTKSTAVKALVAKRRNPQFLSKKTATQNAGQTHTLLDSDNTQQKKHTEKKQQQKNLNIKPNLPAAKDVQENFSLSLNTVVGSTEDHLRTVAKLEKKKLTSKQRKEYVLEKRAKTFKEQEVLLANKKKIQKRKEVIVPSSESIESAEAKTQNVETTTPKSNFERKPKQQKQKKMSSLFANNPVVPIVGQRLVNPLNETVFTGASMNTIGLHDHSVKNLADILHITELTTVQQRTVPVVLSGRDVLVRSQTGSGKTLAYALPIVQKLQEIRPKLVRDSGIQALIIVPTRELAIQSYELFIKLLKPFTWIVSGYLTGGEKRKAEKARLRKGINILVGTPGRLVDHLLHTESFKLDKVKWLVLDEADRLFEMGYEKDVQKIVDVLNENGGTSVPVDGTSTEIRNPFVRKPEKINTPRNTSLQSLLLSATLTSSVRQLAGLALKDPLFIDTTDVNDADILKTNTFQEAFDEAAADEKIVIPATVSQSYILVPPKLRLVTLSGLIALESKKSTTAKILVFLGTEHLVDFHYDLMNEALTSKVLDSDDEDKKEYTRRLGDDAEDYDDDGDNQGDDGSPAILSGVRLFK